MSLIKKYFTVIFKLANLPLLSPISYYKGTIFFIEDMIIWNSTSPLFLLYGRPKFLYFA